LKRVDLPTFGRPTMPQRKPMICDAPWMIGPRRGGRLPVL
jgi:hypothetical protein